MSLFENEDRKIFESEKYNYIFNKKNGAFVRWGENPEDDPDYSEFGPEIMDIEISSGECSGNCEFCYKRNGSNQPLENMSFETFKSVFASFPKTLTQIAFGITDINSNPDFWKIMRFSKENGVIPNYTTNGNNLTKSDVINTSVLCGAVAVSLYDKDICYNAVKMFTDAGMKQVNIHYMLSEETIGKVFNILYDIAHDSRLGKLKAIVFLQYKPHGRGQKHFTPLKNVKKLKEIIEYANLLNVGIGFDSCSTPLYYQAVKSDPNREQLTQFAEPCESGLFSFYMNVKGEYYPCSFSEGEPGWKDGISGIGVKNFISEIWNHPKLINWRNKSIVSSQNCNCEMKTICRSCLLFKKVTYCKDFKYYFKVFDTLPFMRYPKGVEY
jgi:sulfatase maturation enzyme AslB (radical SAM superfamily)